MKGILLILLGSVSLGFAQVEINSVFENVKSASEDVNETFTNITDLARDKQEKNSTDNNNETNVQAEQIKSTKTDTGKVGLKAYQNYDFVPGEKILFEDNFQNDMDGEFPAHWELTNGQAIINKLGGANAFYITDGNYGTVRPRMKTDTYLGAEFTVEFDYYDFKPVDGSAAYGLQLLIVSNEEGFDHDNTISFSTTSISFTGNGVYLSKDLPSELNGDDRFCNTFHHIAIAVRNRQMKVYVDQFRILVVPDTKVDFVKLSFAGIASDDYPIIFKNVRIGEGGKMNMLDKLMTDGKIITHGILFDVNKSSIKPESMGVINQIYQLLKENADLKFEIGGYTDSDGDDNSNLKLSEQRAISVKAQLVSMGILGDRLSTKGYGETNPIDLNTTAEGKANNRRVEFVKK